MQNIKTNSPKWFKAIAWLVEVTARALVGYMVVVNNDHIVATVVGGYFIATALTGIVIHFFKAYSK